MIEAELLFARQSIPDFLSGRGPGLWDIKIPGRIQRQVADGFRSYLRKGAEPPPDVDVGWVFSLPDEMPDSAETSSYRLPDDVAIEYGLVAQRALDYLRNLVPERVMVSGIATRTATTNHAERAKMRRAAAAVEDPIGRLASPEYLSVDAIACIAHVYPELYADAVASIGEAIGELKRPLRAREEQALSRICGIAAKPMVSLKGPDQSQAGSDQRRPRGKAPVEPDSKPQTQRLTER